MRRIFGAALIFALSACASKADDPTTQGSSGAEGTGSSGDVAGTTGSPSETGATTGKSMTGSSGVATTGHASAGATGGAATGATESGSVTGSEKGSSGESGNSSGAIHDAGVMHRDAAAVVLTGCAAQVPTTVFAASCEASPCHNSKDQEYGLDLQSPGVAARLVNQPSLEAFEADGVTPLKLIDPNIPSQSYILMKVQPDPPAGAQMPQVGAKLSSTELECLQQWVYAEAAGPY